MPIWGPVHAYRYSIACVLAPLLFIGLFQRLVAPPPDMPVLTGLMFTPANATQYGDNSDLLGPARLAAANLGGYYDFSITSAFLIIACSVAITTAVGCMWWNWRDKPLIFGSALLLLVALGPLVSWVVQDTHAMREVLIRPVFASLRFGSGFPPPSPQERGALVYFGKIGTIINVNLAFVPVAGMATLLALAGLAGPVETGTPKPKVLHQRLIAIRALLCIVSVPLALTVVASRASGTWILGLLCKPDANALAPIVTAVASYWGAGTTGVILFGFAPAFAKWWEDRQRAELQEVLPTEKDRREWLEREGLVFASQSGIASLLAAGLPALATPLSGALQLLV